MTSLQPSALNTHPDVTYYFINILKVNAISSLVQLSFRPCCSPVTQRQFAGQRLDTRQQRRLN